MINCCYREMVLIDNEDGCIERPLYCGVACVLHCSAVARKVIAFLSISTNTHCVSFSLRFFFSTAQKVVRAQKFHLDILCSKFSTLLNGMYADY